MRRERLCGEGKGDYRQFGDHTVTVSNWFYPATCNFSPRENRACSDVPCVKWTWGIKGMMDLTIASEGCFSLCNSVLHRGKWFAYYKGESKMWRAPHDWSLWKEESIWCFPAVCVICICSVHPFVEVCVSWKPIRHIWCIDIIIFISNTKQITHT